MLKLMKRSQDGAPLHRRSMTYEEACGQHIEEHEALIGALLDEHVTLEHFSELSRRVADRLHQLNVLGG